MQQQSPYPIDVDSYQVFLCASRANAPFVLASHLWFVENDHGKLTRYEVLFRKVKHVRGAQHVHVNAFTPFQGIEIIPYVYSFCWPGRILGNVDGDEAARVGAVLRESPGAYPYAGKYSLLGPNSNTYVR